MREGKEEKGEDIEEDKRREFSREKGESFGPRERERKVKNEASDPISCI